MSATTISIATHKGGTGKTVTAMALAAALARSGRKTLIVDLDAQGHSTLGLGIELNHHDPTLRDIFTDPPAPASRIIRPSGCCPDLDILPSNIRLERIAQFLYMRPKREEVLRRALQPVAGGYQFIVIDCPPSLGALTETGIAAADLIIIPCQMEARAADGLVDLLEIIAILKGDGFDRWRILLTKVDPRKTLTNQAIMGALQRWQDQTFQTVIPQSEPLNQAQIARTDIFSFDARSKGAAAYQALTEEVLSLVR
jgi:chromosome partitioning protein